MTVCLVLAMVGAVIGLAISSSSGFNRYITEDPTRLLRKYLTLDQKGTRLEASSWPVLLPYVDWEEEPAWGHVVVISKFDIVNDVEKWEIIGDLEAKIPVVFEVVGTMHWESATFVPDFHQEKQFFHIKSVGERWQITGPQLPPHVGRKRIIDFVKWKAHSEPHPDKKAELEVLRKQLQVKKKKEMQP